MTEQSLLEKIKKIYETAGGKSAAAVIIEKLGAESFTGDILNPNYVYKIGNHNVLEEDLQLWIQECKPDFEQSYRMLEEVLMQPTKENFLILLDESIGIHIPFLLRDDQVAIFLARLNTDTVKEFEIFESAGFIDINTNPAELKLMTMRPDHKIFEDKKRDNSNGYICAIQLNKNLYT
jgi:hypothetical protein